MADTVKLGYSSMRNISFKGVIDTEVSREQWDEMTDAEKDEEITDALFYLVDIWEIEDGD